MATPEITHQNIQTFAESSVNLQRDSAKKFRDQVNRLREELADHIASNPEFSLIKMLLSGSLAKGAALSTLNDIDVAIYLKPEDSLQTEAQMLDWVHDRLVEAYPSLEPEQFLVQDHSVRISFRGSGLDVDCVPILSKEGNDDWGYVYSQESGEKVLTNIPLQLEFIRKRKKEQPTFFIQVIRILKWWVRNQKLADPEFKFKSFMIEMMCSHLLEQGVDFSDNPLALEAFFSNIIIDSLETRISFDDYYSNSELPSERSSPIEIFDPVNPDNNIAANYSEEDRRRIVSYAQEAYDAITWARWADTKATATQAWQKVLGNSFQG